MNVTINTVDYATGSVVLTLGPTTIAPGAGQALGDRSSSSPSAYCKFTVDTATKNVRAGAFYDNGTAYTVAIPAQ